MNKPRRFDEQSLRDYLHEKIASHRLPCGKPHRMWGGPGAGEFCDGCGETVEPGDMAIELHFLAHGDPGRTVSFHLPCHAAWELECMRLGHRTFPHGQRQ